MHLGAGSGASHSWFSIAIHLGGIWIYMSCFPGVAHPVCKRLLAPILESLKAFLIESLKAFLPR